MSLEKLLNPGKVAVVGASRHEGKPGHEVFDNLAHGFKGEVYPVNSEVEEIEGVSSRQEIEKGTGLAVITVPGEKVPEILRTCGEKNVDAALIMSPVYSESGNKALESEVNYAAKKYGITVLGPDSLGFVNTSQEVNASLVSKIPEEGKVSLMSDSGGLYTTALDYARDENLGFKNVVSLGNKIQVDETDLLEKWREEETETILAFMGKLEEGREFVEKAKETSKTKPVIAMKYREYGKEQNKQFNTGVYRAAFRKSGIAEAKSLEESIDIAKAFESQPLPEGENVAVITNSKGAGEVVADEIRSRDVELAQFFSRTHDLLEKSLPQETGEKNPVNLNMDAGHRAYKEAATVAIEDPNVDAAIILLAPNTTTQTEKIARSIASMASKTNKPVLTCFTGGGKVRESLEVLEESRVPNFKDPSDAVKAFEAMKNYREFLEKGENYREIEKNEREAENAVQNFSGFEDARKLLQAYGFETTLTDVAETSREAVDAASKIGYPVLMKANSPEISHKTVMDSIEADLNSRKDLEVAFNNIIKKLYTRKPEAAIEGVKIQEQLEGLELSLKIRKHPDFGPVVVLGLGGIYTTLRDISYGIPPVSEETAEEMIEELETNELFEELWKEKHSLESVKDAIIRLGELALDHQEKIHSLDINPLILNEDSGYVADIEMELEE